MSMIEDVIGDAASSHFFAPAGFRPAAIVTFPAYLFARATVGIGAALVYGARATEFPSSSQVAHICVGERFEARPVCRDFLAALLRTNNTN